MNYLRILCIDVNKELVLAKRCVWIVWPHLHWTKCNDKHICLQSGIVTCWKVMPSLYVPALHIKTAQLYSCCCCYNNNRNTTANNNSGWCSWAVLTFIIIEMRKTCLHVTDSNDVDDNNNNNKTM
jgi:hypothetical protein